MTINTHGKWKSEQRCLREAQSQVNFRSILGRIDGIPVIEACLRPMTGSHLRVTRVLLFAAQSDCDGV